MISLIVMRDMQSLSILLLVSVLLYCLFGAIFVRFRYARAVPGPPLAAYTRLWYLRALRSGRSSEVFVEVNDKYGPLARIGPKLLLTNDPEIWQKILGTQSEYRRGSWFDCLLLDPHRSNLITERDQRRHNLLRRQMANAYSGKNVDGFMQTIDNNLVEWLEYLETNAVSHASKFTGFDIARSIQWLDFDLVCRLFFGHPFGFIQEHQDQFEFQSTLENRLPIVEQLGVFAEVGRIVRAIDRTPLLRWILPSVDDKSGIGRIRRMARDVVDARSTTEGTAKQDILGMWLSNGLDRTQAETEMVIALFAGSDTTATAIRGILLHIITHPFVYGRVTREIRGAQAAGALSVPIIRFEEACALPYLQACIKEGLRVFPPVAALRARAVPDDGDVLHGCFVQGGTEIGVNLKGLLANPSAFAPDPTTYRPERWLQASSAQLLEMDRVYELVFNWGPTRCLGVNLANIVMSKVMVEVFRRWDVTICNPQMPWTSTCHGVFHQKDFFVRIEHRENRQSNPGAVL